MKIRAGFVSNSSSSSFVCKVCRRTESVSDGYMKEYGFSQCVHGHTFCSEHMNSEIMNKIFSKAIKEHIEEYCTDIATEYLMEHLDEWCESEGFNRDYYIKAWEYYYENEDFPDNHDESGGYEIPEELCPICNFTNISDDDLLKYFIKKSGNNKKQVIEDIKKCFGNYVTLENYVKEE